MSIEMTPFQQYVRHLADNMTLRNVAGGLTAKGERASVDVEIPPEVWNDDKSIQWQGFASLPQRNANRLLVKLSQIQWFKPFRMYAEVNMQKKNIKLTFVKK